MPDLEQRLDAARDDLLGRIQIPELEAVQARASSIRRRRRGVATAGAALAIVAVLGTVAALLGESSQPSPQPATTADLPAGQLWRGGGLTLLGLNGRVLDQPGELRDVEFADADHGYALSAGCDRDAVKPCRLALAATTDGGRTWVDWSLPIAEAPAGRLPSIVPTGTDGLSLIGANVWFGRRGGDWHKRSIDTTASVPAVPDGGRLILGGTDLGYSTPAVTVLTVDGSIGRLTTQPLMAVRWVAPAPAADGAWWVGGALDGLPAVGSSRDQGRTWTVAALPGTGVGDATAQVSTLGSDVFATVISPRDDGPVQVIHAVYRSPAGGPFSLYATMIGTLVGDVVPLLNGGLLAASPHWYVSAGRDARLEPAGGSMPRVGKIERTPGGWIAYNLLDAGWVAISYDGETWQKINVH